MKPFEILTMTAFMVSAGSAMALEKRTTTTCQTSAGSPDASDCNAAKAKLESDKCYTLNGSGSGCQHIVSSGNCNIVVCRNDGGDIGKVSGAHIESAVSTLIGNCKNSNGKVGGYVHYSQIPGGCPAGSTPYTGYINVEVTKA